MVNLFYVFIFIDINWNFKNFHVFLIKLKLINILIYSFFLDADSVGKSRAQVSTQRLLELNPDVRGDFIDETFEQILSNSPDFFNNINLVIASSLPEKYVF